MIKICGIKDAETAAAAVEAGATAIGLVFADSPRQVSARQAAEIVAGLPESIEIIGVFRRADLEVLPEILEHVNLDALQVHRAEDLPSVLHGREVIPGVRVEFVGDLRHSRVLVDSPYGEGSGVPWNFADVRRFASGKRVILAGGLNPENVADAIAQTSPYGVDVSSGVESTRGNKDHAKIRAFVQAARTALDNVRRIGVTK